MCYFTFENRWLTSEAVCQKCTACSIRLTWYRHLHLRFWLKFSWSLMYQKHCFFGWQSHLCVLAHWPKRHQRWRSLLARKLPWPTKKIVPQSTAGHCRADNRVMACESQIVATHLYHLGKVICTKRDLVRCLTSKLTIKIVRRKSDYDLHFFLRSSRHVRGGLAELRTNTAKYGSGFATRPRAMRCNCRQLASVRHSKWFSWDSFISGQRNSRRSAFHFRAILYKNSLYSMVLTSWRATHLFSAGHNCGCSESALSFVLHEDGKQLFFEMLHHLCSFFSVRIGDYCWFL